MLTFTTDMGRFNFRTVGVCIEDDYVLAQRFEGSDVWVLPGGRVEMARIPRRGCSARWVRSCRSVGGRNHTAALGGRELLHTRARHPLP